MTVVYLADGEDWSEIRKFHMKKTLGLIVSILEAPAVTIFLKLHGRGLSILSSASQSQHEQHPPLLVWSKIHRDQGVRIPAAQTFSTQPISFAAASFSPREAPRRQTRI